MCTANELQSIVSSVVQCYQSVYRNNLESIYLYGSYARGDNTADSDIDLVAIVHGEREHLQKQLQEVWDTSSDLELEYGTIISPTVIPYDEFERYREDIPYYSNILKEGIAVG